MATRAQKLRLGIFMLLAFILFFGTIFTLAGLQMWNPRDVYFAEYKESVSGLEIGSAVKMKGVRVGRVETVSVTQDTERVRVTFAMDPGTPITVDTRAVVMALGITGLKFIELTGGTASSKKLIPNTDKSQIKAGASVMQTLTGKATKISEKMEAVLNNVLAMTTAQNRGKVVTLLDNANRLTVAYASIADDNKKRIKRILANVDRSTLAMKSAARAVNQLVEEVRPSVKGTLASASAAAMALKRSTQGLRPQTALNEITRAARALRTRIEDPGITKAIAALQTSAQTFGQMTRQVSAMVGRSNRQVARILSYFTDTASNFKSFSRAIRERPSLLIGGRTLKERKIR